MQPQRKRSQPIIPPDLREKPRRPVNSNVIRTRTFPISHPMTRDDFLLALKVSGDANHLVDTCRRHLLHGTPHVFNGREDEFFEFRRRIADKFEVGFHNKRGQARIKGVRLDLPGLIKHAAFRKCSGLCHDASLGHRSLWPARPAASCEPPKFAITF